MQIQVIVVTVLLLVIITTGLYLASVRRRMRRLQEKVEQPQQNPPDMKSPNTPSQSSAANSVRNENVGTSFEVEPKGTINVQAFSPAQEQVQQTSEERQPQSQQLAEVETFGSQLAIEKKPPIEDTLVEEGEHTQTRAGAVEDLGGKDDKQPQQNRRISPEKRGGRSRTGEQERHEDRTHERRKQSPKPEVVCWKRKREWILGIEIPEELQNAAEIYIFQNKIRLSEDDLQEGYWRLMNLGGQIDVYTSDGDVKIDIGESNYLVFKLSGADLTEGRYVKRPSAGSYLVIATEGWKRDEKLAGKAPAAPEPVCLGGYHAHFFDLVGDKSSQIAFNDRSGGPIKIVSGGPRFAFVGHELHDASEHLGPLFGCSPPRIRVSNGNWADVGTIVVGEEGGGRGRSRESLKPNPDMKEQQLPDRIVNEVGWYFVRFYNLQDELIDSMDFRFVAGLHRITVGGRQLFPSEAGHTEATVEFEHDSSYHLKPEGVSPETLTIDRSYEKTTAIIPPNATYDRTSWLVGTTASRRVRIEILVERIWWTIGKINEPPSQWQDRCLFFSCDDFKATSDNAIWLRLPKCRYTDCVTVGFQRARSREFTLKVGENMLAIPLRDFSDSQEIAIRTVAHSLTVWLKTNGSAYEVAVARIRAEDVESSLDITRIPAYRLAAALTILHRASHGPLRRLLKEVRRKYRRPPRGQHWERNTDFAKESLCVIALLSQLSDGSCAGIPKLLARWRAKVELASREYPEIMQQIWKRYGKLGKWYLSDKR